MNSTLPNALRNGKFIKLKPYKKIPALLEGQSWKDSTHQKDFTDAETWLKDGFNVGFICGSDDIRILDVDNEIRIEEFEKVLPTLTVRTGRSERGGRHFYIKTPYAKNHSLAGVGEFRAHDCYVVAPGSKHPTGRIYEVIVDCPILQWTEEETHKFLDGLLEVKKKNIDNEKTIDISRSGQEWGELIRRIKNGLRSGNLDKEEIFGAMMKFSKWKEDGKAYRDKTWEKAYLEAVETEGGQKQRNNKNIEKSYYTDDGMLYEQVTGNRFSAFKDGTLVFRDSFDTGEGVVVPCTGGELEEGHETVILPPAEVVDYGDVQTLVEEVRTFIHRWVDLSSDFETFSSWYVLLTWVHDRMPSLNYLSFLGDTGTGKSRAQDAIGGLCYRTIRGSGGVTVAASKRLLQKWHGTFIIDEGDFKVTDETAELIKLLNLGFEKDRRMFNCDKNDPSKLEFFDPFGPKLIGRRQQFTDQALEARCLTETMRQTTRKDILPILTSTFHAEQLELRKKLFKFRIDHRDSINPDAIATLDLGDIEPRLKQASLAFACLFSNIPEMLEQFREFLAHYQARIIEERGDSFDGQIVSAIAMLIEQEQTDISAGDLVVHSDKGTVVSARVLGKRLRTLGLVTVPKRVGDKQGRFLVIDDRLGLLFKRYLPRDKAAACVTFVTLHTSSGGQTDKNPQKTLLSKSKEDIYHVTNVTNVTDFDATGGSPKVTNVTDFDATGGTPK